MFGIARPTLKPAAFLFLAFATTAVTAFGATDAPSPEDPGEPISPLFLYAVFTLAIAITCIVVAAIIAAFVAILIALGIVSASACIGLFRQRMSSGLRAFHYQLITLLAIPGGIGAVGCWSHFFGPALGLRDVLIVGSTTGLCAGLLLAFVTDRLASLAYRRFFSSSSLQ